MKQVLVALCLLFSSAVAVPSPENLSDYTFSRYIRDFKKSYSAEEYKLREKIFNEKLRAIVAHNARGASWVESVNQFTDETPEELDARMGIDKSMLFAQRLNRKTGRKPTPRGDLPTEVDWRKSGVVTSIKDQGHCGSCWSFAATECLESHIALQTGYLFTLSEQEFASCVENPLQCGGTGGCEGATMELAYEYAMENGLVTEWTSPYLSYNGEDFSCNLTDDTPNRVAGITGYHTIDTNSYDELIDAVANIGPIAVTVDASTWASYSGGVYDGCNQENPDLDHGVLLVGYGTDADTGKDYWLIRNSWGPVWGEHGYIRIARTSDEAGRCGTDVNPSDGVGCLNGPSNVTVCGTCGILYDAAYPTGGFLQ